MTALSTAWVPFPGHRAAPRAECGLARSLQIGSLTSPAGPGSENLKRRGLGMAKACTHLDTIRDVTPSARGCEECLKIGSPWVHLRICRTCGHVGCCDDSPNRHATEHFHATAHPIIEGYDPPEHWGCVLHRRSYFRPFGSTHSSGWTDSSLLLALSRC